MKNKLILVVAVLVAGLAFLMNWRYLHNEREKLGLFAEQVKVIVPKRDLPSMTVLTIDDLALRDEFKSAVGKNAFYEDDLDAVLGKRLMFPVRRGDILLWSQVDMPRKITGGLSHVVEKGKRAVSLSIAGAPAVSGLVQPRDKVDIMGTFTFSSPTNSKVVESVTLTLMQNVSVLATGSQIAGQASASTAGQQSGYSTVTFEVTPREAELLVFAQQTRGQLYLSLRNPEDIYYETELPSVNFDYIERVLKDLNEQRQKELHNTTK
ncbi:MAG: Flp pilus assembly protein CpaB [Kiritimatiellales bacterium]|nr:Flp pilus assembly protein CpaB [Kiritimatiellales bacterium]MCF7863523.1 Flp pilus assembly protein CpaB [Kiritimatiellales bacterium]